MIYIYNNQQIKKLITNKNKNKLSFVGHNFKFDKINKNKN